MTKEMTKERTIHDVPVPAGVDEKMVAVAKDYVTTRLKEGFKMESLFARNNIAGKTYYKWLKNAEYERYINEMADVLIPSDELQAVRKFRRKVMAYADKESLTAGEMKLFKDVFEPIIEADIRLQMTKLGLNNEGSGSDTPRSLSEKRNLLLQRLKG